MEYFFHILPLFFVNFFWRQIQPLAGKQYEHVLLGICIERIYQGLVLAKIGYNPEF